MVEGEAVIERKQNIHTIDDMPMTPFLWKVTIFSGGASFLDGYTLSLIGVALVQLTAVLSLSTEWAAAIGAAVLVGILVGTVLGGYVTDKLGRRPMFIFDLAAIVVLSILSAFITDAWQLLVIRFLIGVFIGADYPIATSMITEFTPKDHRAISMGVVSASWYLGATAAAFVGFFLIDMANAWKILVASPAIPGILLLIGRSSIPESPMWLAKKGRVDEAEEILHEYVADDIDLQCKPSNEATSYKKVFTSGYLGRIIFLGIFILCQVVPMYAIYTFGPDIMHAFGLDQGKQSILGESVVSLFFLLGTFPAMFALDKFGRRPVVMVSLFFMAVGLLILGLASTPTVIVIFVGFLLYALFSGGPGTLQWLYPNEMFPTEIRATAVGIAIGFSRIGTIVSIYLTPVAIELYGVQFTMMIAAGLVILGLLLSFKFAPETKGKSLSETSQL